MPRSSVVVAACILCIALPETWAAALSSTRPRSLSLASSASALQVGIVHKTEYWGQVFLGTPPKEFSVIFDTGSGNLVLPSYRCNEFACNNHRKYDPHSSKTSLRVTKDGLSLKDHPEGQSEAQITFGTGDIHGQFYQDHLCLGRDAACFKSNFIGTDYESESPFADVNFDGIMGLGFKDLSMGDGFNIIDDVVSQHSLPHNQFSVFLMDTETGSELSFGGYKRSRTLSEVLWAPVTTQSYWQIGIDDVTFNNEKTGLCPNCQVAVDTGTSMMAGPSETIDQLAAKLDVQLDCNNFHSLPLLGFAIGDKVLNLRPHDYVNRMVSPYRSICTLALMTLDVPPPMGPLFIFGDPFLRRFLTIYDRDGPRVGFAVAKHKGVTREHAEQLIATVSGSAANLIKLNSSTHASANPASSPHTSALSLRGKMSQTGALQSTEEEEAEEKALVTVSLGRTASHAKAKV